MRCFEKLGMSGRWGPAYCNRLASTRDMARRLR